MAPAGAEVPGAAPVSVELTDGLRVDLGHDLFIERVEIGKLKEQDVNAHVMPTAKLNRMTENIRQRGHLESMPYCVQPDEAKPIEIVSGHHRIRAARAAGQTHVVVLVDRSPLTRSQIIAKQLAHNALVGSDDPDLIRQLVAKISDVDALLATGLSEEFLPTPDQFKVTLFTPHADYQWKVCSFTFLPHQYENVKELAQRASKNADGIALADESQFEPFLKAVAEFARKREILSASTAVALLTEIALREIKAMDEAGAAPQKESKNGGRGRGGRKRNGSAFEDDGRARGEDPDAGPVGEHAGDGGAGVGDSPGNAVRVEEEGEA